MSGQGLIAEIEQALAELPMFDAHTHLVGGRLGARGLHDILLYHMVVSDLYAAGCPSGARLTQYPGWPDVAEAHARIQEALPYLPHVRNTSCSWMVRPILRDLYDWRDPVTADNWRRLDALIRERADDRSWHHSIFDRLHIQRTCAEHARRGAGQDDDRLQYSLEWAFFTRCQWGEFDTALYELEKCWGRPPEPPTPIGGTRPPTERTIRTLDDVHAAIEHYVQAIPYDQIISTATGFSTAIDYRLVDDRGNGCGPATTCHSRPGGTRHLCLVHQRSFSDGAGTARRPDRVPVQPGRRTAAIRNGQHPATTDDRPTGRHDGPASAAPLPSLSGLPARESSVLYAGPRTAEPELGGLLVAQLLSRTPFARSWPSGWTCCR